MAEAQEHPEHAAEDHGKEGHGAEAHGEGHAVHAEGGTDPLHHIKDKVLFGVDARSGSVIYKPNDEHGHAKAFNGIQYEPKKVGPFKLEFTLHMFDVAAVALLLTIVVISVTNAVIARVRSDKGPQGPLTNLVEICLEFIRDGLVVPIGGHHLEAYTPLFCTYFIFILTCNYLSMIPEFGGATGNIAVTGFLGGSILVILTFLGIAKQGPIGYFAHMVPPGTPAWLWPMMFFLEFIGPLIKSFVLCMRLFGNMIAGHIAIPNILALGVLGPKAMLPVVLAVPMLLIGVPLSLGISMLELLVCFLQAYVFTMLSIIFVGAAVHPEH